MKPLKALVGFAGFGGVDIALRSMGFETLGIEFDPAIAEVNRYNGGNVITADILTLNPADFVGYILMHFSPPCPSYSVARNSSAKMNIYARISDLAYYQTLVNGESEWDIRMARKICEFIRACRPEYFTLENVWGYQKSLSWQLIKFTLLEEGYGVDWWHLNAADYGVPQTRKRMIAVGRRDGRSPVKPWPTHARMPDMFTNPWRGWYETIEDLIPDLPESEFAPWQMDRALEDWKTFLMMTSNTNRNGSDNRPGRGVLEVGQPANAVTVGPKGGAMPRAYILGQSSTARPKSVTEPYDTVTASISQTYVKAFLVNSQNTTQKEVEPIFTVNANAMEKNSPPKAFIVDCQNNGRNGLTIRTADQPVFTMTASANRRPIRAGHASGRVVSMTARALARFQDFPDWFILPGESGLADNPILLADKRTERELACRGIGNALPPGMYRAVLESLGL